MNEAYEEVWSEAVLSPEGYSVTLYGEKNDQIFVLEEWWKTHDEMTQ